MVSNMPQSYWEKRQDELMAGLDKRDEKFSNKVNKEYQRLLNDLEKDIAYYYQTYGVDDVLEYRTLMAQLNDAERDSVFRDFDSFVASHPEYAKLLPVRNNIYKLNRLEGLQMSIRMKTAELGVLENDLMTNYLKSSYEYGYMSTIKHLKNASSFFSVNNPVLEELLNDKWFNDKNYSDRIWDNKNTLKNWLTSDLKDGIISGKNYGDLVKSLTRRIDTGEFYAKRLIWTESAFFMNSANARAFMDDGILKYRYTSILDNRTSKICIKLNDQEFEFKDYAPGVNAPPMHSFCRSTIIPIENDEKHSKEVYNGDTESPFVGEFVNYDLSKKQAAELLLSEFDMEISETARTKLSEVALNQTYSVLKTFENIYNALPQKIPQIRAISKSKAGDNIAWYSRLAWDDRPVEFGINVAYFENDKLLQDVTSRSVSSGWFSKNENPNHIMIHEFAHHVDFQLSKMQGSQFSDAVFDKMVKKYEDKYDLNTLSNEVGGYANSYYRQNNKQTETFAEIFAEAYGETPREIALDFKKEFEELSEEVIKHADDAKGI